MGRDEILPSGRIRAMIYMSFALTGLFVAMLAAPASADAESKPYFTPPPRRRRN
jgi:hypothetical protein